MVGPLTVHTMGQGNSEKFERPCVHLQRTARRSHHTIEHQRVRMLHFDAHVPLHHGCECGQISYDSRIAHVGEILKSLKMHNIKIDR